MLEVSEQRRDRSDPGSKPSSGHCVDNGLRGARTEVGRSGGRQRGWRERWDPDARCREG